MLGGFIKRLYSTELSYSWTAVVHQEPGMSRPAFAFLAEASLIRNISLVTFLLLLRDTMTKVTFEKVYCGSRFQRIN